MRRGDLERGSRHPHGGERIRVVVLEVAFEQHRKLARERSAKPRKWVSRGALRKVPPQQAQRSLLELQALQTCAGIEPDQLGVRRQDVI